MEGSVIVGCLQCMAHSGYTVVTGSWDKALMVWDIRQEDAVQMLHGHREGKSKRRMLYKYFMGTRRVSQTGGLCNYVLCTQRVSQTGGHCTDASRVQRE